MEGFEVWTNYFVGIDAPEYFVLFVADVWRPIQCPRQSFDRDQKKAAVLSRMHAGATDAEQFADNLGRGLRNSMALFDVAIWR